MHHRGVLVETRGGYIERDHEIKVPHRPRDKLAELIEEEDERDDEFEEEVVGAWHKTKKGLLSGRVKGWNSKRGRGLPKRVKSGPLNKCKGKSPWTRKKRGWGCHK